MPAPIPTASYLNYFKPLLQAGKQSVKNSLQAGKTWGVNGLKKLFYKPVQQKFKPEALDEILSKVTSADDAFIKALDTYRGASTGAPATLKELQGMADWAKSHPQGSKALEEVIANYIKNSTSPSSYLLQSVALNTQPAQWKSLVNSLQPGQTLKFDPLTRTLQAVDAATGQAVLRPSTMRIGGTIASVGVGVPGAIYGGPKVYGAVSDMLGDMSVADYIESVGGNRSLADVTSNKTTTGDTPQGTENLPQEHQQPTEPVSSTKTPAPDSTPTVPATTTDASFVDKALQWGKDNPDLVSLLSLLAVGAGGVGLYSLLDDDEEEEDEEEEY